MTQAFILSTMTNEELCALVDAIVEKVDPTPAELVMLKAVRDELLDRQAKLMCLLMDEEMMV